MYAAFAEVHGHYWAWIGVDKIGTNGTWVYSSTRQAISFTNWANWGSQFDGLTGISDCAIIASGGGGDWFDQNTCSTGFYYICEFYVTDKTCPNNCSGQGTCDGSTGTCNCNTGFTGADCAGKKFFLE